jgi:hypothetical protein
MDRRYKERHLKKTLHIILGSVQQLMVSDSSDDVSVVHRLSELQTEVGAAPRGLPRCASSLRTTVCTRQGLSCSIITEAIERQQVCY